MGAYQAAIAANYEASAADTGIADAVFITEWSNRAPWWHQCPAGSQ